MNAITRYLVISLNFSFSKLVIIFTFSRAYASEAIITPGNYRYDDDDVYLARDFRNL